MRLGGLAFRGVLENFVDFVFFAGKEVAHVCLTSNERLKSENEEQWTERVALLRTCRPIYE